MLSWWVTLAVIAQAPAPEPIKLALPGLAVLNLPPAAQTYDAEYLAQQLTLRGVRTVTAQEIGALLGLDRQRELLGCANDSCLAELGNALGVDGLLLGTIGKFDQDYQVDLKVISARDGKPLSAFTERVRGERGVLDALDHAATQMATDVGVALNRPVVAGSVVRAKAAAPSGGGARRLAWIPAAVGVALAGGGTALALSAKSHADALNNPVDQQINNPRAYANQGNTFQTAGIVLFGAAGVALAGAGLLYGLGGARVAPSASFGPGGATVGLVGEWR